MKKYLMMGAAALAMTTAFVSCSKEKDLYNPTANAQNKLEQYKKAFESVFGDVAEFQTWGFGASSRATRAVSYEYYAFPADADASKFLADVPAGIEKLAANAASVNNYIDETWTGELNVWGAWDGSKTSGGTLYMKGNCDFSNRKFYFAGNSELYLVAGATLTLSADNAANLQTNCKIYIAPGAKLIANGELKLNNGLHIYNHGTIETPKLSTNSNSVLYNVGTVTVTNKISVENELSVIVNDGTITAADLNTAGSGKFLNNKNVTISGNTVVNSNNNTWVNNGQYHTGYFFYHAASDEVINNCRLTVDEDFNINLGDNSGNGCFKLFDGAGVVTKNFNGGGNFTNALQNWVSYNGGPFYIYMGAASVFKVTETATMNATKADYGVYGPESGAYAVFQAKNIVAGAANQGYEVTYGGNLYVSAETHFAQGYSGQYPYIDFKAPCTEANIYAEGFTAGKPEYSISGDECNPGFEGEGGQVKLPTLHVMAEDLSATQASDFDFNDITIDVLYVDANNVDIVLQAAGGTLPLRFCEKNEWEVHKLFNLYQNDIYVQENGQWVVNPAIRTMVNTGTKYHVAKAPYAQTEFLPYVTRRYNGFAGWSTDQDEFATQVRDNIKIEVSFGCLEDGTPVWSELGCGNTWTAKIATPTNARYYGEGGTPTDIKDDAWYFHASNPKNYYWAWEKQFVGETFRKWVKTGEPFYYLVEE